MRRFWISLSALCIVSALLTGCWDRKELNELGIVVALGIDTDGDQISVSAQIVVPSEVASNSSSGRGSSTVTVYEASAPTIFEAIQKLTENSPRRPYLSHIRILVLGEEFARQGIADAVESLVREPTTRTDFYVVVARGHKASDILKVSTAIEKIPANKMFTSLEASAETWAPTDKVTIDQLMTDMVTPGTHPVLTGIESEGDLSKGISEGTDNIKTIEPTARLTFTGLGVFKHDRLIGWLNESESKGYNYIRDKVKTTVGHADCEGGGQIGLLTLSSKTDTKAVVRNGEPIVQVHVTSNGSIREVKCKNMKLASPRDIKRIEEAGDEKLIAIMRSSVETVRRKYKVDIFGFGQLIHQSNPKAWKSLKKDWDKTFLELPIEYSADTKIKKIGTIFESFQKKMKE